jgi:hypothetical protein
MESVKLSHSIFNSNKQYIHGERYTITQRTNCYKRYIHGEEIVGDAAGVKLYIHGEEIVGDAAGVKLEVDEHAGEHVNGDVVRQPVADSLDLRQLQVSYMSVTCQRRCCPQLCRR